MRSDIKYIFELYKDLVKEHAWKDIFITTISLPVFIVIVLIYGEDFNG